MAILSNLIVVVAVVAAFIQYRLSAMGVSPVVSVLPPLPAFPPNDGILTGKVQKVGVDDLVGPESLVTATHNDAEYMFAGLGEGRIVRLSEDSTNSDDDDHDLSWTTVIRTGEDEAKCGMGGPADSTNTEEICGRPLGMKIVRRSSIDNLKYDEDEDVIVVADAYKGLLMISGIFNEKENGGKVHTIATRAKTDGKDYKFQLLNGIVQAPDGSIYISETTQYFKRRRIFHAVFDGSPTGRLLRYSKGKGVEVVAKDLYMANGLALSHDKQYILVVSGVQILQYSLERREMMSEPFVGVMAGTGDNIDAKDHLPNGKEQNCYWAGYGSRFAEPFTLLKALSEKPLLKGILCALVPYNAIVNAIPKLSTLAVYGEDGALIDIYQDFNAKASWLSEAEQFGEHLYLASW